MDVTPSRWMSSAELMTVKGRKTMNFLNRSGSCSKRLQASVESRKAIPSTQSTFPASSSSKTGSVTMGR